MKTFIAKNKDIKRKHYLFDAANFRLGRMATRIASLLMGKNKPEFAFNQDVGDYVTVVNCKKIKLSGQKRIQKEYFKHSGYIGSIKSQTIGEFIENQPEKLIKQVVKGMLPSNRLLTGRLKRLTVVKKEQAPKQEVKLIEIKE